MTDEEFKVKFDKLRSQEVKMAYVLKGVQKAYHEMPNSKMNPSRHRRDLVKGSKILDHVKTIPTSSRQNFNSEGVTNHAIKSGNRLYVTRCRLFRSPI